MLTEQPLSTLEEQTRRQQRGLLVMRMLYFFYFAGIGTYWTFINVYYREIGLSGTQIGLVNTLAPMVSIFSATFWGLVNDRLGRPRLLLMIAAPGTIVGALALSAVQQFGWIILFACTLGFFNSAIPSLMDNTTLRLLDDRRGRYGRYRVLGSVGFILTSYSTGIIFARAGLHWLFIAYSIIMAMYLIAAANLPNERIYMSGSVWRGLNQLVRQPTWLLFAISAFLLWVSNNGTMNFIGITVQMMGGSPRLIGLVWMMTAVAEIPIMLYSDTILRRVGNARLIIIAFCIFTLRGVLLALLVNQGWSPSWAPVINTLGGFAYGFFWISAVQYANDSAPAHLKSTGQGLLFSILNLASMAGASLSGWLFDQIGPGGLYWVTTVIASLGLMVFLVGRLRYNESSR